MPRMAEIYPTQILIASLAGWMSSQRGHRTVSSRKTAPEKSLCCTITPPNDPRSLLDQRRFWSCEKVGLVQGVRRR